MKIHDITEAKSYQPPEISVGDEVKVGKFKNRKAEIKGFDTDDHGQPVLKTTKGDQKLFKPRISKLEPKKNELDEVVLTPNKWHIVASNADKSELSDKLISAVQLAYAETPKGSFVNSLNDVLPSDWHVLDIDSDDDIDAAIFTRKNRSNESWQGTKIQGIGHDGARISKQRMLEKLSELLNKPGVWIEASGAMRAVLLKRQANLVTDVTVLNKLFGKVRMIDKHTYQRKLANGEIITDTVFGNPNIK